MLEVSMNELTLGLGAAAITLLLLRKRKRSQGVSFAANDGFADTTGVFSAAPSTSRTSTSTQTSTRSATSDSNSSRSTSHGHFVQNFLRSYNRQYAANTGLGQRFSENGLTDGIIGPATRSAWVAVAQDWNFVLGVLPSRIATRLRLLENMSEAEERNAIAFVEAWIQKPEYWQVLARAV